MYCQNCGIYNPDESKACQICRAELVCGEKPDEVRIFVDLAQYPLKALLHSWKGVNPLLMVFFVPVISILWCLKKIFRKPFFTPVMNGCHPKLHIARLEEVKGIHKKSLNAAISFFTQNGFELFTEIEDFNMSQGVFQRLMINREKNIYGTIHITRATGKVSYITFSAITRDKTLVSLSNTYGVPIRYPKNLKIRYIPNLSVNALYEEFIRCLSETGSEAVMLPLSKLLPLTYKVSCFSIQLGLRQGCFHAKDAEKTGGQSTSPTASTCFFHPFNAAVRKCSGCGTAVCEACYTSWGEHNYCDKCLVSKKAESPDPEKASMPGVPEDFGFAGFGLRSAAAVIDLSLISILTVAVFMGISYGAASFMPEDATPLSVLVSQMFFVGFALSYLIVPVRKSGRTFGQKILGLQVIDRDGNPPDTVAAVIRTAYHLLSCLFIFPVIGYLFILFRKRKQGFHDQLSDTFVITKPSRVKALAAWVMLILIFVGAGGFGFQRIMPVITMFTSDFKQEMALEQRWIYPKGSDKLWDYAVLGDRCIVSTTACLSALDTRTGEILWTADNLANTSLSTPLEKEGTRLMLLKDHNDKTPAAIFCIDSESGTVLWESAVEAEEPQIIFDSQSVLVHGANLIREYDLNGNLLWEQRFQDKFKIEYVQTADKHILLVRYSESATGTEIAPALTYIERFSGKILWEEKNSVYQPGYAPGNGYQFFYRDKGGTALMYMPEQRVVWEPPQNINVMAHDEDKSSTIPFRFYTWKSGVLAGDGATIFAYPPDTRMGCLTDSFIVLLPDNAKENFRNGVRGKMLLADKTTGEVKVSYEEDTWLSVARIAEEKSAIYLLARVSKSKAVNAELLFISKNTLELKRIPIGKNIYLPKNDFEVFPQQQLVFIPTYMNVGGYALPLSQN